MSRTLPLAAAAISSISACALAANPLTIDNALTAADAIATGFNGPDAPNANTFYHDAYTITVSLNGSYSFEIDALDAGLAPWIGLYNNDFNPADYFAPAPLTLNASQFGGDTVLATFNIPAGTYQVVAASYYWIEESNALDEGAYRVTITGPQGADIVLIPAPATLALLGLGLATARRRRAC